MKVEKRAWLNWRQLVIDDRELSFAAKGMALYLNTFMNDSHDMAYPSLRKIEGELSLTRKTVIKHLTELENAGYISKGKHLNTTTTQIHNSYTALIPSKFLGGGDFTPPEVEVVESLPIGGGISTHKVVESLHTNKQGNKQKNKQCANFAQFWNLYPNKKNKKRAETAFKQLSNEKQDLAISDISSRYKETEKRFIPHPTTYIHGERWEDETEESNVYDWRKNV